MVVGGVDRRVQGKAVPSARVGGPLAVGPGKLHEDLIDEPPFLLSITGSSTYATDIKNVIIKNLRLTFCEI